MKRRRNIHLLIAHRKRTLSRRTLLCFSIGVVYISTPGFTFSLLRVIITHTHYHTTHTYTVQHNYTHSPLYSHINISLLAYTPGLENQRFRLKDQRSPGHDATRPMAQPPGRRGPNWVWSYMVMICFTTYRISTSYTWRHPIQFYVRLKWFTLVMH